MLQPLIQQNTVTIVSCTPVQLRACTHSARGTKIQSALDTPSKVPSLRLSHPCSCSSVSVGSLVVRGSRVSGDTDSLAAWQKKTFYTSEKSFFGVRHVCRIDLRILCVLVDALCWSSHLSGEESLNVNMSLSVKERCDENTTLLVVPWPCHVMRCHVMSCYDILHRYFRSGRSLPHAARTRQRGRRTSCSAVDCTHRPTDRQIETDRDRQTHTDTHRREAKCPRASKQWETMCPPKTHL